jgi:spermidine synthase
MSTSKLEQLIYQNFIDNATGDVLIFGLGLGFIIFPLLTDESITSVTVIDNDVDIINTVSPIIEKYDVYNKLQIVEGDLNTYHQQIPTEKYDYIYFDIWSILTSDIVTEATALSLLYEKNKKTDLSVIDYCCSDLFGSKNSNKISNVRI